MRDVGAIERAIERPANSSSESSQPSEWLLLMRKVAIFLWLLLAVLLVAKMLILDICSAGSLAVLMIIGYAVPFGSQPLKVLNTLRYGGASLFFCGMDTVFGCSHIIHFVRGWKSYYPLVGFVTPGFPHEVPPDEAKKQSALERYLTAMSLFAVIVSVILPVLEGIITFHCYTIYKEQRQIHASAEPRDEETQLRGNTNGQGDRMYGAPGQRDQRYTRAYQPFEGRKYRLSDT